MFWTEELYNNAYDIVKDRKFPIIIMSYNRPNPIIMNKMFSDMTDEYNYPIFIYVRKSQEEEYRKYLTNKYATIVSVPDEEINSAGKTREGTLMWLYNNGYKNAFTIDDDVPKIGYSRAGKSRNGNAISIDGSELISSKVLAMWQLSMEYAQEKYGVIYSIPKTHGCSWVPDSCNADRSMLYSCTVSGIAMCWNVKEIVERGIKFEDNSISGFDDADFVIKLLADSNNKVCNFPFIWFDMPKDMASVENFDFDTIEERFTTSTELVRKNHGDKEYVRYKVDKHGLPGVAINWSRYRKMFGISEYRFNIWNDGKLLEEARRNYAKD